MRARVANLGFWTLLLAAAFAILNTSGCSTAKKKTPELSELEGKKVALIDVEGEATSRAVVEVALINQLIQNGTFILIPKKDVEAARKAPEQDPTDWKGIAKRAGSEFALRAKVIQFDAETKDGYISEEVEDSQLAEERGEKEGKTKHLYKAKSMTGQVKVELQFVNLADDDTRVAVAEAEKTVSTNAKESGNHLPPKLRFLENLSNEAFRVFFEKYN